MKDKSTLGVVVLAGIVGISAVGVGLVAAGARSAFGWWAAAAVLAFFAAVTLGAYWLLHRRERTRRQREVNSWIEERLVEDVAADPVTLLAWLESPDDEQAVREREVSAEDIDRAWQDMRERIERRRV